MKDILGAAILCLLFLFIIIAAELWQRSGNPHPEWTRKFVHLCGGLVCIFFPFFIASPWIVLFMTLIFSGIFAWASHTTFLKSLTAVDRKTRGSEYYPLAVFVVFLFAHNTYWLYLSALLTLAIADAFAALVGSHYGRIKFEVENSMKSLEGSLTFLIIAFLSMHLPMLLLSDLPRATSVLAALLVAILLTGFEFIALKGSDNLFVPIGSVWILSKITRMSSF
jgi:phytol kinase